jgi:hypothetical protein
LANAAARLHSRPMKNLLASIAVCLLRTFFDGDQATYSDTRSAIFLGTKSQLMQKFFPAL